MAKKKVDCSETQALTARLFITYGKMEGVDPFKKVRERFPAIDNEFIENAVHAFRSSGIKEAKERFDPVLESMINAASTSAAQRAKLKDIKAKLADPNFTGETRKAKEKQATVLTELESQIADAERDLKAKIAAAAKARAAAKAKATRQDRILTSMKARRKTPAKVRRLMQMLAAEVMTNNPNLNREQLIDAVHDVASESVPDDWTRRDTMDAISGYGDFKQLSKDEIAVKLRDLKGQMQQVAKLEDMIEKGIAPLKTGVERRSMSDEERRLVQEVAETKKRLGIQPTDPETELKSSLDAIKTRLKNQISDLNRQIAEGRRIKRTVTPVPRDAEALALEKQRDTLKKQLDALVGPDIDARKQRLKKAIDDLTAKIAARDLATKPKPEVSRDTDEQVMVAQRAALNKTMAQMRRLAKEPARLREAIEEVEARLAAKQAKQKGQTLSPFQTAETEALQEELAELRRIENIVLNTEKLRALAESIKMNGYTRAAKVERIYSAREEEVRFQHLLARRTADMLIQQNEPRSWFSRIYDEMNNTMRGMLTFADDSAVLGYQGGQYALAHPVRMAQIAARSLRVFFAVPKMADIKAAYQKAGGGFKGFVAALQEIPNASERLSAAGEADIKARKNYPLMVKAKLPLTLDTQQEEVFLSELLGKYMPFFKRSAAAFKTVLNLVRADMFDAIVDTMPTTAGNVTLDEAKAVANAVGTFTGRGNALSGYSNLHRLFFAPKNLIAKFGFAFAAPVWFPNMPGANKAKSTMRVRQAFAREFGRYYLAVGLMMTLAKLLGGEVEDDPRSSDFGRVKFGDRRIDVVTGREIYVALAQFITGKKKKLTGGIEKAHRGMTAFNFLRKKLAPLPSAGIDMLEGKDVVGKPVTPGTMAKKSLVPIGVQSAAETIGSDEHAAAKAAALILNFFGGRSSDYSQ